MKQVVLVFATLGLAAVAGAQTGPSLTLQKPSPNQLRLLWTSQAGISYQPDTTSNIDPFALWTPFGNPVTASGSSSQITFNRPAAASGFYRVRALPNNGLPSVRIVSPAQGQTVNGLVTVVVNAADDRRLSSVTLYLDGVPIETKTEGDLTFRFHSAHYPNGQHQLVAVAADNNGIPYLGGTANANVVVNQAVTPTRTLTFQNPLRWLNADPLFEAGVSISAESDVFPTDYTVYVEDEAGATVKAYVEHTANGVIESYWDGTDEAGNPVPEEKAYTVVLALGDQTGQAAAAVVASGYGARQQPQGGRWVQNQYGAYDLELSVADQFPVLPPLPPGASPAMEAAHQVLALEATQARRDKQVRRVSLREYASGGGAVALLSGPPAPPSGGGGGGGPAPATPDDDAVFKLMFKERSWSSSELLLARQKFSSSIVGATFNAVIASMLGNIRNLTEIAANSDEFPLGRGVWGGSILECKSAGDFNVLSNDLSNVQVTHFYYYGHSDGNAIGFSESTPNNGLTWQDFKLAFDNGFKVDNRTGTLVFRVKKPFRFVFIDGCNSANGKFPEVFGIPSAPDNPGARNYSRRAFMGWKTTTQDSIANNSYQKFSERFWLAWLDENQSYERPVRLARDIAGQQSPSVNAQALEIFGNPDLTWRE